MYNFFLSYQNQGTSNYPEFLERMEVRNQKVQVTLVVYKLDIQNFKFTALIVY